jgi:alpha-tubulin suppressor-like RCC1 family protein
MLLLFVFSVHATSCGCGAIVISMLSNETNVIIFLKVYTWGDNDEGQLGDGTTTDIQKPRLVAALQVIISFQKSNGRCNHVTSAD